MNNLNYTLIDGTLARDPITRSITSNAVVCQFVIANNRYFKKKDKDEFFEDSSFFVVETWGDLAEQCMNKLAKGTKVRVIGRLKQARWDKGNDPEKPREKIYIVAEHVEIGYQKKPDILKSTVKENDTKEISDSLDEASAKAEAEN